MVQDYTQSESVKLDPQFADWLEAECKQLAKELQPLPKDQEPTGMRHPDRHIDGSLGEEDLVGSPTIRDLDIAGRAVVRYFESAGEMIGLDNKAFADAQRVVDKMWARQFRDLLTRETIEDVIFEHVAAIHGAREGPSISERLVAA